MQLDSTQKKSCLGNDTGGGTYKEKDAQRIDPHTEKKKMPQK